MLGCALLGLLVGCGHAGGAGGKAAVEPPATRPVAVDVPPPPAPDQGAIDRLGAALADAPPPPPQSVLRATLRLPLSELQAAVDRALPRSHAQAFHPVTPEGKSPRVELRYRVERDAVAVTQRGDRLELSLPLRYWADLRGAVKNPLPFGKRRWFPLAEGDWGTRAAPQRITLRASVRLSVGADYGVRVATELSPLRHGPPPAGKLCVKAGIRFCTPKAGLAPMVRKRIEAEVRPRLKAAIGALERALQEQLAVAATLRSAWAQLGCPLSLTRGEPVCGAAAVARGGRPDGDAGDDAYLHFVPGRVGVAGPGVRGRELGLDVAVGGQARVVFGAHPGGKAPPLPAPEQRATAAAAGPTRLALQVELPYAAAGRELTRRLADFAYGAGAGQVLRVREASVEARVDPKGARRLLIRLRLAGAAEGSIYLWGTPDYDPKARRLRLRGLDYTLQTGDRFVAALERMNHARFREALQARAVFDAGPELDRLRALLLERVQAQPVPGLQLAAKLEAPTLSQPVLTRDRLVTVLSLSGSLDARLRLPD